MLNAFLAWGVSKQGFYVKRLKKNLSQIIVALQTDEKLTQSFCPPRAQQKKTEGATIMKCEPPRQHALHIRALLKVSVSTCFCRAAWL